MELIFIRHAQPEWVRDGKSQNDPRLTAIGQSQAQRLGECANAWKRPTEVIVSPKRRALETAHHICATLQVTPVIAPWFEEIRMPDSWEGAPAELVGEFLLKARHRNADEWWEGMPGGESFRDFQIRITTNLTELLAERGAMRGDGTRHSSVWNIPARDEHRIVFVGHGGSNSAAISFLLGIETVPWPWERFVSYHASISRVKVSSLLGAQIFGLRSLSDVAHLPVELQTR